MDHIDKRIIFFLFFFFIFLLCFTVISSADSLVIYPMDDGDVTQLTPSAATNWESINESDGNVRTGSSSWKYDLYNLTNHASESGLISNITVYQYSYRGSGGSATSMSTIKIGGNTYNSSSHGLTTNGGSDDEFYDTWATNPSTGSAWSWSDIDDLQAGVSLRETYSNPQAYCKRLYVTVNYYQHFIYTDNATDVEETSVTLCGTTNYTETVAAAGWWLGTSSPVNHANNIYNKSCDIVSSGESYDCTNSSLLPGQYYYFRSWYLNTGPTFRNATNEETFLTKPYAPTNLQVEEFEDQLNLSWSNAVVQVSNRTTVIAYKTSSPAPTSPSEGTIIYNDTGTTYILDDCDFGVTYYFSAWTYINATGSPFHWWISDTYDTETGALSGGGNYNITVRYENESYGFVDLDETDTYHSLYVYYTNPLRYEKLTFNSSGVNNDMSDMTSANYTYFDNGQINLSLDQAPRYFRFVWNETKDYINVSGNASTTAYSCDRKLIPASGQFNITFYIRTDLPVYPDTSYYKNDSLCRFTYAFLDPTGFYDVSHNARAYFYKYDSSGNQQMIHSEYFSAYKTVYPWLIYGKSYVMLVACDEGSASLGEAPTGGDVAITDLQIPHELNETFSFVSLVNYNFGWLSDGIYFDYFVDSDYDLINITFYLYGHDNDTLLRTPEVKTAYDDNFTINLNTSYPYRINCKAIFNSSSEEGGTYWLSGPDGRAIIPGITDTIISADRVNELLELLFGETPLQNEETGETSDYIFIVLFVVSFILMASFSKLNAFVGGLSVGLFLMIVPVFVSGIGWVILIGTFIMALSFVGLLGGVETK